MTHAKMFSLCHITMLYCIAASEAEGKENVVITIANLVAY